MAFVLRLSGVFVLLLTAVVTAAAAPEESGRVDFFEKKIRPILVNHCYNCHSADTKPAGGLRVDDRNGLISGGNTGAAIMPRDPGKSLLLKRITQKDAKKQMPLEGKKLTDEQVADLTKWIKDGAAWPAVRVPASIGKPNPEYAKHKKEHWAWQPLTDPKPPAVADTAWPKDNIDRFVLAKLEANGLKPVADADSVTLIRRITFDLTGLPPAAAEIDAYLQDASARPQAAVERLIDRLLASPQFGERWGRHWLDVARYGESTGPSRNIPYPHAWRYRDYVINAVNADVPFNRFIQEQIAGDLLSAPTDQERDRLYSATGFLALGVKDVNQRFKVRFIMDNVDEQIDAVTCSVLALTVSCARCHDHKFDPIPTTDYYALAGIFTSTDNCAGVRNKMGGGGLDYYDPSMLVKLSTAATPAPAEQIEKLKLEVAQAKKEWDAIRGTPHGLEKGPDGFPKQRAYRLKLDKLEADLLISTDPAARGHAVHGVRDAKVVGDTEVRIRGEAEQLGPLVPRGFLSAIDVPDAARINPKQSGRFELARWLTSPQNPLAARVIVNRVWAHLFGRGIVSTVDNFGVMGDRPSNPELLDHLASRFIDEGWSIKKLVRTLVLTRAYQLGSESTEANRKADPLNRLVWRHTPRRLDAEEIRDAVLAASGRLDLTRPVASPAKELKMIEMRDDGPEARTINDQADKNTCRSVYLPLVRGVTPRALEAFDPVEQTLVTGSRDATTVPSQALFLLNSSFIRKQSLALAERLLAGTESGDADRIQKAYRLTLGRIASKKELERVQRFLAEYEIEYRQQHSAKSQGKSDASGPKDARTAAWLAFAQALIGSAEFRYVR